MSCTRTHHLNNVPRLRGEKHDTSLKILHLWYYNQSGVTELLILRDPQYDRMCFKSVKTLRVLHS